MTDGSGDGSSDASAESGTPSVAARDELAGVVDLFGALTREELSTALGELAFKAGTDADDAAISAAIDAAVEEYSLVAFDPNRVGLDDAGVDADGSEELFAVGPTAFPTLPDHAEDLPHILDVADRAVDRTVLAELVRERLADETDAAVADGDAARCEELLDVCYDLEAWAPVTADAIRERLAAAVDAE